MLGLVLLIVIVWFFHSILRNLLLVLGVSTALGFTILKGINLHGLEAYYSGQYEPFRGADLIELSGAVIAALAALIGPVRTKGVKSGKIL